MGSKKEHKRKKEHKHRHKKRHRRSDSDEERRSRSPSEKRRKTDSEKKHNRKHKEGSNEVQIKESASTADSLVKEEVSIEEEEIYVADEAFGKPPDSENLPRVSSNDGESLSIEETNRIRAKLGLKPLDLNKDAAGEASTKSKPFVHAPAENLRKKSKEEEMRIKLQARRENRELNKKLSKVKTLGKDDEESAASWVLKSRKKEAEIKREKVLSAVEDEFGIGNLVEKEFKSSSNAAAYTEKNLKGLNVEHSLKSFGTGKEAILVIKDKDILASDDEDVLHSVSLDDHEKAKKNLEIKRKGFGYKAYEEEEVDELGFYKAKTVLGKYDEEIEGETRNRFTIGEQGLIDTSWEQQKEVMRKEIKAKGESLALPKLKLMSEYLTEEEMKFKKRKRKIKKVRKRDTFTADSLTPLPGETSGNDHGCRSQQSNDNMPGQSEGEPVKQHNGGAEHSERDMVIGDEDEEDINNELQKALQKTRAVKSSNNEDIGALKVAEHLKSISEANLEKPQEQFSNTLYLNATNEFCQQLGASFSQKPEVKHEPDMEVDDEMAEEPMTVSTWSSVVSEEAEPNQSASAETDEHAPIEAEPLASSGLLGALRLAQHKGYLNDEGTTKGSMIVTTNKNSSLYSKNYAIEDKNAVDYLDKYANEKYMKDRNRFDRGMVSEFAEKKDYKPKVEIEYVDDRGRLLSSKEAFRKLSHRFHGKGSGKTKQEKRMKKSKEEETMKHMSSTDTPLNTVAMMKEKLRSESSPYIVLSGAGKTLMAGGSLAKTK